MARRRTALAIAGATIVAVTLSACGGSSDSGGSGGGEKTIAFSHPTSSAPVTQAVIKYAKKRAKELGYKLLTDSPDGKVDTQVSDVETWITQGVDAICIFPIDNSTVAASQQRAQDAGIKWTTYAGTQKGADGAVLFSHEQSGTIAANDAVSWIKKQKTPPEVAVLTGSTLPVIAPRTDIPIKEIEAQTDAKIVAKQDALDQQTGLTVMENILQAHPNVRVVIGINDDGALGAMKAFKDKGIDPSTVYISGQDGTLEALQAVKENSYYKATVSVNIAAVGAGIVDSADQLLTGKGKGTVEIPPVLGSLADTKTLDELIAQFG